MRRFTRLSGALLALVFVLSLLSGCSGAAPDGLSGTASPTADAVFAADAPSSAGTESVSPDEPDEPAPSLSAKTESIPPPKMLRSICISTAVCRRTLSPKRTPALSAGAAAVWMTAPTANASAETGLGTMKDGCRTRRDANTASATSIRCTPPPAGRSASYTPTTGSSIIPRTTMRALYCFMAKNDAF